MFACVKLGIQGRNCLNLRILVFLGKNYKEVDYPAGGRHVKYASKFMGEVIFSSKISLFLLPKSYFLVLVLDTTFFLVAGISLFLLH